VSRGYVRRRPARGQRQRAGAGVCGAVAAVLGSRRVAACLDESRAHGRDAPHVVQTSIWTHVDGARRACIRALDTAYRETPPVAAGRPRALAGSPRPPLMKLHNALLIGLVLGIVLGAALHPYADTPQLAAVSLHVLRPIGQIFLRMIFMIVV